MPNYFDHVMAAFVLRSACSYAKMLGNLERMIDYSCHVMNEIEISLLDYIYVQFASGLYSCQV